jgi:soluble lytic murein transglycosylase
MKNAQPIGYQQGYRVQRPWVLTLVAILLTALSCRQHSLVPQPPRSVLPDSVAPPSSPPDPWAAYRSVLEGDSLAKQREIFRLGYRFLQEKNLDGARLFFTRALEVYPPLADYSLYYLGVSHREAGHKAEAKTLLLRLLAEYPDSVWVGQAALDLATYALAEHHWTEAAHYAERARTSSLTSAAVRHTAALLFAQAKEGQGDISGAYSLYQQVRRATPGSSVGRSAKLHVERLRASAPERFGLRSAQEYLEEIRLLTKEADGHGAGERAREFAARFPDSPLHAEVQMLLAALYKRQGRIEEAIALWKEVATRSPQSAVAPAALHAWASALWNKDRDAEARLVFERLIQRYPQHSQAAEAWYAIGRILQEQQHYEQAAAVYQRLATLFPESALAREGRWRQGWMAYRQGDFRRAEELFAALAHSAAGTPEGESALYWRARAAEQCGLSDAAARGYREVLRRYPDGYYALWAEKRLRIIPPPLELGAEGTVSSLSLPPALDAHYRRSQELAAIGLLEFARRELDVVREGSPHDLALTRFLLSEYSRVRGHAVALRLALGLARQGGNWRRYLFPHAYWDTVNIHALQKRLDPYLILALIRQESLFDPYAVSPAQAYGLMQLLPSTAARITNVQAVSPTALTDPEFNIATGTAYLRWLLDRYGNNPVMAIAAYNAGENAVDKWRERYANGELDEFVENISYRETRNYVKLVLRNYRTYRRLYDEKLDSASWPFREVKALSAPHPAACAGAGRWTYKERRSRSPDNCGRGIS